MKWSSFVVDLPVIALWASAGTADAGAQPPAESARLDRPFTVEGQAPR